ncbi:2-isopropylmalate synthase [Geomicrobium sp. JCM 19038]|uniref:2-isopropylmalate synthase n=1 Tax=Geomicrobium sp. JCM 19038 TaxID=1460635 RepID=UPI00045F35A2|nr:2-isopropylmalate synthase [Geomicrobium sp. JCM 19038]GAK09949.1 2-isopropylmalate synthase [Geomicrobium sp. JCM 19038]
MREIDIFDTTLRDGEQQPGLNLNLDEKLEIAKQLDRLGVNIIEAGFPASNDGDFHSVQKIARAVKNSTVTGLSRVVKKDIDTAYEALKDTANPRIHIFIATSDIHIKHKLLMTQQEVLDAAVEAVRYAKQKFPVVQFSAEDACRTSWDFLTKISSEVIRAGVDVINLPDTVGYTTPNEIKAMFQHMKQHVHDVEKIKLSAHNHDDLGMAVANSLAAIEGGADQVECTINGIGERAGNASLEEIAVALQIRKDYYAANSTLKLNELKRTSNLVSKLTGTIVPGNKAIVGANAFAHESGIHQDGVLKESTTYEIITPELVGVEKNSLPLGKLSGKHAFKTKITELGFELEEEDLKRVFKAFKDLAHKKKSVTDDDIFALLTAEKSGSQSGMYELKSLQVNVATQENVIQTATVIVRTPDGEEIQEAATGKGSVEAVYNTLSRLIGEPIQLEDYRIQSVTGGEDALAEVVVHLTYNDESSLGRGTAHDVLEASAFAYLNAVNRIISGNPTKEPIEELV